MKDERDLSKKKIENMNSKTTTNSQLLTTEAKKNQTKNKLNKQLEQEQNQRNGYYTEGFQ